MLGADNTAEINVLGADNNGLGQTAVGNQFANEDCRN